MTDIVMVDNQMDDEFAKYEHIHVMPYGDPGSEKTTFAASFPKPMCVLFFDKQAKG